MEDEVGDAQHERQRLELLAADVAFQFLQSLDVVDFVCSDVLDGRRQESAGSAGGSRMNSPSFGSVISVMISVNALGV